ncbi:TetR/AcrR family transcriptional regulator [Paenibacillus flagellatus]|uniref:TetR family transcriptional regulator n=1 Tax=Paenibacillus flagellatus TaxID=2211139 RepID=A0A2V5JVL5_9BACL|nr:TetR-like C-terminal domain-containing protein [Paenibacillus flagellatus]PYI50541.1 TetR family transcriptional regulator [Paenibacillus flagellatus]
MPRIGLDLTTLLQTAAELADEQGIDEVTLASLAKKLNIRTPSLYNHIDGLPGLRHKLTVYGLEQLYDKLTLAAVGRSGDEAVRAFAEAYLAFARSRPGLYELTLRAPGPEAEEVGRIGGRIIDLIVRILAHYELSDDAALHAVRGLRSILHGFASLEQKGGFGLPLDLDVTFRLLLDAFIAGLSTIRDRSPGLSGERAEP